VNELKFTVQGGRLCEEASWRALGSKLLGFIVVFQDSLPGPWKVADEAPVNR
jgi:hypothetical protein